MFSCFENYLIFLKFSTNDLGLKSVNFDGLFCTEILGFLSFNLGFWGMVRVWACESFVMEFFRRFWVCFA